MLLFTVGVMNAQAEVVLETSFNAIKTFFIPSVLASILVLFADASKHLRGGTWDTEVFFTTKLKPFLITMVLAVAIYFLLAYLPISKAFIEILANSSFAEISAAGIIGMATAILDGLTKSKSEISE
jgi:hypothetical protein